MKLLRSNYTVVYFLAFVAVFAPASAGAESFSTPILCKGEEAAVIATNRGPEVEPFWFQNIGSRPFQEKLAEVLPGRAELYSLAEQTPWNLSAVAIKTRPGSHWQFQTFCKTNAAVREFSSESSPWKSFQLRHSTGDLALNYVNLSQQPVTVQVRFFSRRTLLKTQLLQVDSAFAKTVWNLRAPPSADKLEVRSDGRWVGALTSSADGKEFPATEDVVAFSKVIPQRYFLMTPRSGQIQESFVLPLTNPKLISEALEQIANPNKPKLLVARIEKGLTGVNRNFGDPAKTPWSWQVAQAFNFADFAHISCDGSPSVVEERLDDYISNTAGTICFWNYGVNRELTAAEVQAPSRQFAATREMRAVTKLSAEFLGFTLNSLPQKRQSSLWFELLAPQSPQRKR